MKTCTSCRKEKSEVDGYYSQFGKIKQPCKECRIQLQNKLYQANKKYYNKQRNIIKINKIAENKEMVNLFKEMCPCRDCGKYFIACVMEFDHIDHINQNKFKSVSRLVTAGASTASVLREIKKTDLLCILCHRLRTYNRGSNNYNPRRKANYDYISHKKRGPCTLCGKLYQSCQMDFDHIDPNTKSNNLAQMLNHSRSKIDDEIAKCRILCAVCHRIETFKNKLENKGC